MKEKVIGAEKALGLKDKTDYNQMLLDITKEQWEIDQKITSVENQIWRAKNEKLSLCDAKMHLEKKKTAIYVKLGMVFVKPLKAIDMES